MPQPQHLGVSGLFTDPNALVAVPEGALERAEECEIKRVGLLEPRPGFSAGTAATSSGTGELDNILALHPYRDAMLIVGAVESTTGTVISGGWAVATEAPSSPVWFQDYIRTAEARGNLYLNTRDTPRKITGVGADQTAYAVGVIPPLLLSAATTGSSGWLNTDEAVSYRLVIKRTDANGVEVYSAPSGRVVCMKTSGTGQNVFLIYAWRLARSGDELQIYRSRTAVGSGVQPDDEHFLVYSVTLGTATGTGSFTDYIPAERLGAPLYIDEEVDELGEEDADASNWRPPACKDITLFRGSMFYVNQIDYARVTFARSVISDVTSEDHGIGYRVVAVTYTNGSATIGGLSASELKGIQVGQLVSNPSANMHFVAHPLPVYVTAINAGAGEITVSSAWNGSTGAGNLTLADSIRIDCDGDTYLYPAVFASTLVFFIGSGGTDPISGTDYARVPELHALGIGTLEIYENASPRLGFRRIVIEALSAETSFNISATHGDDYTPALAQWAASPPAAGLVEPNVRENQLGWSKTEQPEHYLLGSFQAVGNSAPLLRAIPTRDALWLFKGKGDGIYRASGFGASTGFRIDQKAPGAYLLRPGLVCVLENDAGEDVVYAWTNKGLIALSDSGAFVLSGPIANLTREFETNTDHSNTTAGAIAVANPKSAQVIFSLRSTGRFVYSPRTKGWTKWFVSEDSTPWLEHGDISAGAYHLTTRELWFGQDGTAVPHIERTAGNALNVECADTRHSITITENEASDDDGLTSAVTIAGGSSFEPIEGALLEGGVAGFGVIIAVADATHFTVRHTAGFAGVTGVTGAYDPFVCTATWLPKVEGGPGIVKRFQQMITHWEQDYGLLGWDVTLSPDARVGTPVTYTRTAYERPEVDGPGVTKILTKRALDHRAMVPRAAHRAMRLKPSISIRQADARWSIGGLSIDFEPVSTRVHR